MSEIIKAAKKYLKTRGWWSTPLAPNKKLPRLKKWQDKRLNEEEIDKNFNPDDNIGLILGKPSGWIVDLDFDLPKAAAVAQYFLPETNLSFGRGDMKQSHLLFISEQTTTKKYTDPVTDSVIVEIRSTGCQTMIPPSIHPSGETVEWFEYGDAAQIDKDKLLEAVNKTAAAALLACHWPEEGTRQDAAMHLSGALAHANWDEKEIETFLQAVVNEDDEKASRLKTIKYAVEKIKKDTPVTGWPKLSKIIDGRLVNQCRDWLGIKTELPKIKVNNRQLRDMSKDTLHAIEDYNNPAVIFKRETELTRVIISEDKGETGGFIKRPVLEPASEAYMRNLATRAADFYKVKKTAKEEYIETYVNPPIDVIRDIMSLGQWPFPTIHGLTQTPVFREDGTLFDTPGYDPVSCLYYMAEREIEIPTIKQDQAVDILKEPFLDFPFVDEASLANTLATVITITLRTLINGCIPGILLNKHQQGSGATLLANVFSIIGTGSPAYMETWPSGRDSEEELRKRVTSTLLAGRPLIVFDNIEHQLKSAIMGAVLTTQRWKDRLLGKMVGIYVPQRAVWVFTGNNLLLGGDMTRRCYEIKIDPKMSRPWQRKPDSFKHPQLLKWVHNHREQILGAIYSLARSWIKAGRPVPDDLPVLGSFEEWSQIVGSILSYSGINGFLANLEELYEKTETDDGWMDFLTAWYNLWEEKPVKVAELVNKLHGDRDFASCLPVALDVNDKSLNRKLGNRLRKHEGARFPNGVYVERAGTHRRAILWSTKLTEGCTISKEIEEEDDILM